MTYSPVVHAYYDWLVGIVWDRNELGGPRYNRLFTFLFNSTFVPTFEMDNSRVNDAIDLRYRFANECGFSYAAVASDLNGVDGCCNMLELMLALAIRMEEHIMADEAFGNRTGQWFWQMVISLDFGNVEDGYFDERLAEDIIVHFNNHEYSPDGKGSLFTVPNCPFDMRKLDIWYQMQHYITANYSGGI